jgi:hypothetical protein
LAGFVQFVQHVAEKQPGWALPLTTIAMFLGLPLAGTTYLNQRPDVSPAVRDGINTLGRVYRWVGIGCVIGWGLTYIPERHLTWSFVLMAAAAFAVGARRTPEPILIASVLALVGFGAFIRADDGMNAVYWPNAAALIAVLGLQRVMRRMPERYPVAEAAHHTTVALASIGLWIYVSRWVMQSASGFYLTATWSAVALALFLIGMTLRERMYRWLGLGILACALGRVVLFDIWKLDTLYRILSFMAIGIVLLVLGFIYNKFQEKIKEWL